jgi:hypothetical protein
MPSFAHASSACFWEIFFPTRLQRSEIETSTVANANAPKTASLQMPDSNDKKKAWQCLIFSFAFVLVRGVP